MRPINISRFIVFVLTFFTMGAVTFYSCRKEILCEGCVDGNRLPIAIAGLDQVITLPIDSFLLNGNSSNDQDGTITKWLWTKISGPISVNIAKPSEHTTKVYIATVGTYQFELIVTDNGGLSAKDTVQIIVKDAFQSNYPPIANARGDQTVTLPTNTVTLDGDASTDPDNNIASYLWAKISGPPSYNIANANIVQTQVANLIEGVYQFELTVSDAGGLFSKDTTQITVNHDAGNSLVDIYVAGDENGVVVYWKNGKAIPLENRPSYYFGTSISVVGGDIGVAATRHELMWNHYGAKHWKNGQQVVLGTYSGANSIALDGGDVYVAGWEWEGNATSNYATSAAVAKYWKNGEPVPLTDGTIEAYANSIVISGNDIYVAGEEGNVAKYWKNGQAVLLTDGLNQAYARSIIVVGNDVYVAGSEGGIAKYWKNGFAVSLSQGNATSIAVSGSDVYVAAYDGSYKAKYWKNGQEVMLTTGTNQELALSITVVDNDVYVAGWEGPSYSPVAKYWKNGQAVLLTKGSNHGHAGGIVVVKH